MLLAGDVGGTKTSLVIFDTATGPRAPLAETTLPSDDFASLEDLVGSFLAKTALPVTHAAFGVAGPVVEGSAKITNLPGRSASRASPPLSA